MLDRRSNRPSGTIGSAHTPWVFNVDLKIDKKISFRYGAATVFMRITNLFDKRNVLNVYEYTDSANNDGLLTSSTGDSFIAVFASDVDGNGVNDFVELYTAINDQNHEAYRTEVGKRLFSPPRQIFVGLTVEF